MLSVYAMFWGAAGTMGVCPPGYLASLPANRAVHGSERHKIHSVRICGLVDLLGRGVNRETCVRCLRRWPPKLPAAAAVGARRRAPARARARP